MVPFRSLVPSELASFGDDLYLHDVSRPLLAKVTDSSSVTSTPWGDVSHGGDKVKLTGLHADAAGCWVTGSQGVVHVDNEGKVSRLTSDPVAHSALHDGVLAYVPWRPHSRMPTPSLVSLTTVHGFRVDVDVAWQVMRLTADQHGFLLFQLSKERPSTPLGHRDARLARLSVRGELRPGPMLEEPADLTVFATNRLSDLLVSEYGDAVRLCKVEEDLTSGEGVPISYPLDGWDVQGRRILVSHAPTDAGPGEWWPMADPPHGSSSSQRYVVSALDPDDLHVTTAVTTDGYPMSVAAAPGTSLWVLSNDDPQTAGPHRSLMRWDLQEQAGPQSFDLDPLLESMPPLNVDPPAPQPALLTWMKDQAASVLSHLTEEHSELRELVDELEVDVRGAFHDAHVVARFALRGIQPLVQVATAYSLFDIDGTQQFYDDVDSLVGSVSHELLELLGAAGDVSALAQQPPDDEGLVWLRRPWPPEGILRS